MKHLINVGVIGCETSEEVLLASGIIKEENICLKILATDDATAGYAKLTFPQAEIVSCAKDIVEDNAIELVFVSSNKKDLPFAMEALQAGKQVRIV